MQSLTGELQGGIRLEELLDDAALRKGGKHSSHIGNSIIIGYILGL